MIMIEAAPPLMGAELVHFQAKPKENEIRKARQLVRVASRAPIQFRGVNVRRGLKSGTLQLTVAEQRDHQRETE